MRIIEMIPTATSTEDVSEAVELGVTALTQTDMQLPTYYTHANA